MILNSEIFIRRKKEYKKNLIYNISHKNFMSSIPLRFRFDEIDRFIKIYDGLKYLELFGSRFYDRIKYFISKKSGITDSIKYNFAKIRIDSYNSLPIEKILTFS